MSGLDSYRLGHVGLFVHDLDRMASFYARALGFVVTDEHFDGQGNRKGVFLSRNPAEHHQLVLVAGRSPEQTLTVVQQVSFRVASLAEVRRAYFSLRSEHLPRIHPTTHGTAWSVYFHDPEENRMEVYAETDWYITQPFSAPIDLTQPEEMIRSQTEALCRSKPGFRPLAEWRSSMAARMRAAIDAWTQHQP
jgi:catechol 2,3-dioxygenase